MWHDRTMVYTGERWARVAAGATGYVCSYSWNRTMSNPGLPAWLVARTDDNGIRVLVYYGLDQAAAEALVGRMEARGHKQSAWAEQYIQGCLYKAVEKLGILR